MILQRLFLSFMRFSIEFGYSLRRVLLVPGSLMTWLSVVVLIPMLPAPEAHFWARCKIQPLWSVYPLHQAQFRGNQEVPHFRADACELGGDLLA